MKATRRMRRYASGQECGWCVLSLATQRVWYLTGKLFPLPFSQGKSNGTSWQGRAGRGAFAAPFSLVAAGLVPLWADLTVCFTIIAASKGRTGTPTPPRHAGRPALSARLVAWPWRISPCRLCLAPSASRSTGTATCVVRVRAFRRRVFKLRSLFQRIFRFRTMY